MVLRGYLIEIFILMVCVASDSVIMNLPEIYTWLVKY